MRDPKRIRPLLDRLEKVWTEHLDLRLGQLIAAAAPGGTDVFYLECEELVSNIEKVFEKKYLFKDLVEESIRTKLTRVVKQKELAEGTEEVLVTEATFVSHLVNSYRGQATEENIVYEGTRIDDIGPPEVRRIWRVKVVVK